MLKRTGTIGGIPGEEKSVLLNRGVHMNSMVCNVRKYLKELKG